MLLVYKYKSKFKQSQFLSHSKHHSYGNSCFDDMIKWINFLCNNSEGCFFLPSFTTVCTLFYLFLFLGGKSLTAHGLVFHHLFTVPEVMPFIFRNQKPLKVPKMTKKLPKYLIGNNDALCTLGSLFVYHHLFATSEVMT